jgi:hypothetical protein
LSFGCSAPRRPTFIPCFADELQRHRLDFDIFGRVELQLPAKEGACVVAAAADMVVVVETRQKDVRFGHQDRASHATEGGRNRRYSPERCR